MSKTPKATLAFGNPDALATAIGAAAEQHPAEKRIVGTLPEDPRPEMQAGKPNPEDPYRAMLATLTKAGPSR